jgi:hypothetical protein
MGWRRAQIVEKEQRRSRFLRRGHMQQMSKEYRVGLSRKHSLKKECSQSKHRGYQRP